MVLNEVVGWPNRSMNCCLAAAIAGSCGDVLKRAETKIADIDQKLRALKAMRKALARLTAACEGGRPVSECPILESFDGEEHP